MVPTVFTSRLLDLLLQCNFITVQKCKLSLWTKVDTLHTISFRLEPEDLPVSLWKNIEKSNEIVYQPLGHIPNSFDIEIYFLGLLKML